jgi:CRP/FNR family transcriptional regulator
MTSGLKTMEEARTASPSLEASTSVPAVIPRALEAHAAVLHVRRGQTIALTIDGSEAVFVVRSGALMLHLTLSGELRQVVAVLYPGDVLRSASVPSDAGARLSAVSAGEILRLRQTSFAALAEEDAALWRYVADAAARQTARHALHLSAVGRFDCEQRVANFLLELALRMGTRVPGGGVGFELPLSRTDMADYLGLNADTLSRTMSRLRSSGLLNHPERHRAVVRDLTALAALSPAAPSLTALYASGR